MAILLCGGVEIQRKLKIVLKNLFVILFPYHEIFCWQLYDKQFFDVDDFRIGNALHMIYVP